MKKPSVLIVGTGPAALMAATVLSEGGRVSVTLLEKRKSPGRKLLIAGSSGLNITNAAPLAEFAAQYSGSAPEGFWLRLLHGFGPEQWLKFIETELDQRTFLGTSQRYFVREMKASHLLRAWLQFLGSRGVHLRTASELTDFNSNEITVQGEPPLPFDALIFALGGASYEPHEVPLRWPAILDRKGLRRRPFEASNVGHHVPWRPEFLLEAEGKPLKNMTLTTARGQKRGELVITRYGIEGTPVYTVGCIGDAWIDLKPEFTEAELLRKCQAVRENLSPIRRVKKQLGLNEAALALIFHHAPPSALGRLETLISVLKRFPLRLTGVQPLTEAISSRGGLSFEELIPETLELKQFPRVFCAGEMLDWDAPTGGYLIQGAVSTGFRAGRAALSRLIQSATNP